MSDRSLEGMSVVAKSRMPTSVRFWMMVDKRGPNDCWLWQGGCDQGGYGRFSHDKTSTKAHRFAWMDANGPIPEGLSVCHNCPSGDNPRCVNPAHLWLGTDRQNAADRHRKGRDATGERHGSRTRPDRRPRGQSHHWNARPETRVRGEQFKHARLTDAQAKQVKQLLRDTNLTQAEIGRRFGVSKSIINRIARGRQWTHIQA